jgi:uncharacterized protein
MNDVSNSSIESRRSFLCCGTLLFAGLFAPSESRAFSFADGTSNPCWPGAAWSSEEAALIQATFDGIDAGQYIDVHAHLLGTGDSGSGCFVHPSLYQLWRPIEVLRRKVILNGACVDESRGEIDRQYVSRMQALLNDFPFGAKSTLFAFDRAYDDAGRADDANSTFHVPNTYAQRLAKDSNRFEWVASIHPYRDDVIEALARAKAEGAIALKWLPSAMNIDWKDKRCVRVYEWLAREGFPLISHFGEEKAVPGANKDDFVNPLYARIPLEQGVRLVVAHCATLGHAHDLESNSKRRVPCFDLFARLMNEKKYESVLFADVSAVFQSNRKPLVWQRLLREQPWHARLLQGSDYPLPGVWPLYDVDALAKSKVLDEKHVAPLKSIRRRNPLLFEVAMKRHLNFEGHRLAATVFETRRYFSRMVM